MFKNEMKIQRLVTEPQKEDLSAVHAFAGRLAGGSLGDIEWSVEYISRNPYLFASTMYIPLNIAGKVGRVALSQEEKEDLIGNISDSRFTKLQVEFQTVGAHETEKAISFCQSLYCMQTMTGELLKPAEEHARNVERILWKACIDQKYTDALLIAAWGICSGAIEDSSSFRSAITRACRAAVRRVQGVSAETNAEREEDARILFGVKILAPELMPQLSVYEWKKIITQDGDLTAILMQEPHTRMHLAYCYAALAEKVTFDAAGIHLEKRSAPDHEETSVPTPRVI